MVLSSSLVGVACAFTLTSSESRGPSGEHWSRATGASARTTALPPLYQRFGSTTSAALSAGFIDAASEKALQILLFILLFCFSDTDLHLTLSTDQVSGFATIAAVAAGAVAVAVAIALLVPALRSRFVEALHEARSAFRVLRSPRKLTQLVGGNLFVQLLFAATLGACTRAFGLSLDFTTLLLVNCVVSLLAGLLPVPGGIGVSEASLALGLTRAGVPAETAFAIAIAHRLATFDLPPLWGYWCYRWMAARSYV